MSSKIFVNLPVKDLTKSIEFFKALGYSFNPQFTNDDAGCLVVNDHIFIMLVTQDYYKTFMDKELADTTKTNEAIMALSFESKDEVDKIADKAIAAGAKKSKDPSDQGFMYTRSFEDLDGHLWEMFWMDPSAIN